MNYKTLTDEELVKLSKESDSNARETLISRYTNAVNKIVRPLYLEGGDINDLIIEGMIGINKAIDNFNFQTPFTNFAFICIKSSVYSTLKKAKSNKNKALSNYISFSGLEKEDDIDKNDFMQSKDFNPEQSVINNENESELKELISSSLSNLEKNILKLYLQGFSYNDISLKIEKNVKTIDNAIQRIRKKLERKINEVKEK